MTEAEKARSTPDGVSFAHVQGKAPNLLGKWGIGLDSQGSCASSLLDWRNIGTRSCVRFIMLTTILSSASLPSGVRELSVVWLTCSLLRNRKSGMEDFEGAGSYIPIPMGLGVRCADVLPPVCKGSSVRQVEWNSDNYIVLRIAKEVVDAGCSTSPYVASVNIEA